ncbi:unnamed protein product [Oreochromis niloticus]|nr:unnamed protein product [Mustela putorius furo]
MWRSVFSRTASSDTDGFEELDSCYLEPDGFLLPIFGSRDEQLPTSETTEVPTSGVSVNLDENEKSLTNETDSIDSVNAVLPEPSDVDGFEELDSCYLEPDGFLLPIVGSRDEQLATSETTEVPTSSVSANIDENEKSLTNESDSIDSVNAVLPEPSDVDGSEENEINVVRERLQREEGETIFSRVQTSFSGECNESEKEHPSELQSMKVCPVQK